MAAKKLLISNEGLRSFLDLTIFHKPMLYFNCYFLKRESDMKLTSSTVQICFILKGEKYLRHS